MLYEVITVVDAQRTALQAERGSVQVLGERLRASVLLIKALGGGLGGRRLVS